MMKQVIIRLSRGMLIYDLQVEVEDGVEDRTPHNY